MPQTDTATTDSAAALEAVSTSSIPWLVVEVRAMPDYQLFQRFADGMEGRTEMRELIFSDHAGVFAALRDPAAFAQVSIDPDFCSVRWANGLDIAPDATHEDIQRYGIQILR